MYDLHISSGKTSKSSVIFSSLHAQVQNIRKGRSRDLVFSCAFYETKKDSNYHMTWETQDRDFICFRKDTPITVTSMIHNHDGYEIYSCPEISAWVLKRQPDYEAW